MGILWRRGCATFALVVSLLGCTIEEGDQGLPGAPGPGGPPQPTVDSGDKYFTSPGVNLTITQVTGGAAVGSTVRVDYTLLKDDGTPWDISEMDSGLALISGPTFNYQRVIPRQNDLRAASVSLGNGTYRYTFASPMPATYAAPYNDTTSFGASDGELTGQALLAGTYTVYLNARWDYTVDGEPHHDIAEGFAEILFGGAATVQSREVVLTANCNQCHLDLRAHGENREDARSCVLCHTSGAEDKNVASAAGGTPGVSIDFRVLIHKIHNGAHLPSVGGVSTNTDGSRNYGATAAPYLLVGFGNSVHDFSHVHFPRWPSLSNPMPRDAGYSSLTTAQKAQEDEIRRGAVDCNACHGGAAQASVAYTQPTRRSCGSCHDDVVWTSPYVANGQTMAAQTNDANCTSMGCHPQSGTALSVVDAHLHPWSDPAVNAGLFAALSNVVEAGTNDGDLTFDPGEKVSVTVALTNTAGGSLTASAIDRLTVIVSGPEGNRQVLNSIDVPLGVLSGAGPYTFTVPQAVAYEYLGDATGASNETLVTGRTPLWDPSGAATAVFERTATSGGATTTATAWPATQRWIDVSGTTSFAVGDPVVVEDGVAGQEEYLEVALVESTTSPPRLWFTTPTRLAHTSGVSVDEVVLTPKTLTTDYTVTAATGTITANGTAFGAGNAIVVTYTTDFVWPATYPPPLNDGPDLDETWGNMVGKNLIDGTYLVGAYARQTLAVSLQGQSQSYRNASPASVVPVLFGSASNLTPYTALDSAATCNACHGTVMFHGSGRRDLDTCLLCHAGGGTGDRARWSSPSATATNGVTIDFRTMLHKIHHGADLPDAGTYTVNGFGGAPHTYEEVHFPAIPEGVKNCTMCHGTNSTAWYTPSNRDHPSQQTLPVRNWRASCTSCHSGASTVAHADLMTSLSGAESCATCHGKGRANDVTVAHRTR